MEILEGPLRRLDVRNKNNQGTIVSLLGWVSVEIQGRVIGEGGMTGQRKEGVPKTYLMSKKLVRMESKNT